MRFMHGRRRRTRLEEGKGEQNLPEYFSLVQILPILMANFTGGEGGGAGKI